MRSEIVCGLALLAATGAVAQQKASMVVPAEAGAAVASSVNPTPAGYVIGPADLLTISVLREAGLSGSLLVRPDGMVSMPLLGDVAAAGRNPEQLAEEITAGLKKFIQDPHVVVVVTQINSKKIYMIGEVAKVGPVEMTPGMTLLEAVASAGGLTQYANSRKIYILRKLELKQEKIPVKYKQALKGDSAFNVLVQPGDTIVVP